jgi:putative oxidoreductase
VTALIHLAPEVMLMRCGCLYPELLGPRASAGLLPLRVAMGLAFVFHGWPKIQNALGWMGAEAPVPGFLQALAAVAEFGGGIALALGLLTRVAAVGILCVMITALATVHIPHGDPFVGKPGQHSAEPATVYLCCAVLFLVIGPGRFSLDALLFGRPKIAEPEAHV